MYIIVEWGEPLKERAGGEKVRNDNLAEWLRRETRNLMGFPAQVQILQLSLIFNLLIKYNHNLK